MKTRTRVPLVRRFSPVPDSPAESDEQQFEAGFNYSSPLTWEDIDKEYRSVILVLCPSNTRIIILALPATGGLQCRADANFPLWFSHRSNANR